MKIEVFNCSADMSNSWQEIDTDDVVTICSKSFDKLTMTIVRKSRDTFQNVLISIVFHNLSDMTIFDNLVSTKLTKDTK